jgi:hypothetical protein
LRISREALRRIHPHGKRLLVRCPCRALNVISGLADRRSRLYRRQRPRPALRPRA